MSSLRVVRAPEPATLPLRQIPDMAESLVSTAKKIARAAYGSGSKSQIREIRIETCFGLAITIEVPQEDDGR